MVSNGRQLLGEHFDKDHLTHEELVSLELEVVTENGRALGPEEVRGHIFRFEDRDEPSGYVVKNVETTGTSTLLCYLRPAS